MFTDVSHLFRNNPPARHYGVAVTDIDGDGRHEFVVAGYGCPNRILRFDGFHLWDIAPRTLADPDRQAIGLAAGDVDGDGKEELYVLTADTFSGPKTYADRLFDHDPTTGLWHDLFQHAANRPARTLNAGRSVAVIDRRGTGRYGCFVANYGRPFRYYELGTGGNLIDLAPPLGLNFTTGGRGLWVGPFVSDRPDILCVNENGINFLLRNTGLGTFLEIAADVRLHDPEEHARGVAVFDADDDGRLDVAWTNWEGPHRLMIRQPDGTFRDRATPALALPSTARNVIAADFDNDGFEELFFNNLGEPNRLFRCVNGEMRMIDPGPAALPEGLGTGAAVADVD
ncbi:MAG: VCBS repeat-containing protein, partial [Acidimicrobiales bacterium]|nr:VCBS repeat-containing protein [Acidimicrobiales bacterium]